MAKNDVAADTRILRQLLATRPDTESVAGFVAGPGIQKLPLRFDIDRLQHAVIKARKCGAFVDQDHGFQSLLLTRRPGQTCASDNDLSGRYTMRRDNSYTEVDMEQIVDEAAFSEFDPAFSGSYFEHVFNELSRRFTIGRLRVLAKDSYNCNSWHRDPEPRLHIPVFSNPGSLFVVNHHCTHLPADGSVYFTDTRGYHTALNGGPSPRVHIVAALPIPQSRT